MPQTSVKLVLAVFLLAGTLSGQNQGVSSSVKGATPTDRVCLSEILISTKPSDTQEELAAAKKKAMQLRDFARSGASFARLATLNSQGPSAETGGSIGCFKRGQLAKPIEKLVFGMKIGDVSDVLSTRQGLVILQVTGNEPPPTFEPPPQTAPSAHDTGVTGTVAYGGNPIPNAYVLAHQNGKTDVHARTDAYGKYAIPLALGIYDVFISADGFSPTSRKIAVMPDGMVVYDAVLEGNGLGMQM